MIFQSIYISINLTHSSSGVGICVQDGMTQSTISNCTLVYLSDNYLRFVKVSLLIMSLFIITIKKHCLLHQLSLLTNTVFPFFMTTYETVLYILLILKNEYGWSYFETTVDQYICHNTYHYLILLY